MSHASRAVALAVSLGAMLAVAGCSASPPEPAPRQTTMHAPAWSAADGVPTEAQYRQAIENQRQCVIDEGIDADPVEREVGGTYNFSYDTSGLTEKQLDDPDNPLNKAWDLCWRTEAMEVQRAYLERRYIGVERDQKMAELIECLEEEGYSGFEAAETSSLVFIDIIERQDTTWAETDPSHSHNGTMCFGAYRGVWPAGDPNSPPQL